MTKRAVVPLIALVGALSLSCSTASGPVADTVYKNGRIYTVNEKSAWAEAVAPTESFLASSENPSRWLKRSRSSPSVVLRL